MRNRCHGLGLGGAQLLPCAFGEVAHPQDTRQCRIQEVVPGAAPCVPPLPRRASALPWQSTHGGRLWNPSRAGIPSAGRVLVYSEYLSRTDLDRFGPPDSVVGCSTWEEVLKHLDKEHPGQANIAVYPCAAIQCPDDLDE